jgi:hypothetical protein
LGYIIYSTSISYSRGNVLGEVTPSPANTKPITFQLPFNFAYNEDPESPAQQGKPHKAAELEFAKLYVVSSDGLTNAITSCIIAGVSIDTVS